MATFTGNARRAKARAFARTHGVKYTEALREVDRAHRLAPGSPWPARARGLTGGGAYDPALVCGGDSVPGEAVLGGAGCGKSVLALDAVLRTALLGDVTQVVFDGVGDAARVFARAADLGLDPARVKVVDLRASSEEESGAAADLVIADRAPAAWPDLSQGDLLVVVPPVESAAEEVWSATLRRAVDLLTALPREWSKALTVDALPYDCPPATVALVNRLARTGRAGNLYLRCVFSNPLHVPVMNVGAVWVGASVDQETLAYLAARGVEPDQVRHLGVGEFLLWRAVSRETARVEAVVDARLLQRLRDVAGQG